MSETVQQLAALIRGSKHISLVIHQQPDGDAIGSAVAIKRLLSHKYQVEIVSCHPLPEIFTQAVGEVITTESINPETDLIILLDCAQLHRTGLEEELRKLSRSITTVGVDHHTHASLGKFVKVYIYDKSASSTTEIIYDCLNELRYPITSEVAQALLLGIFTDTGGFRHANTSEKTLRVAGRLISCGANPEQLHRLFETSRTIVKSRLWGYALSQVKINSLGIASVVIRKSEVSSLGATVADLAGLANNLSQINEAKAAIVLIETIDGWRCSFRTRHPHIDLRRFSKFFGGRGTQKATGFLATKNLFSGKIL